MGVRAEEVGGERGTGTGHGSGDQAEGQTEEGEEQVLVEGVEEG